RAGITRRLRSSTGKGIATSSEKAAFGPRKQWSKVTVPSESKKKIVKRKTISSSDSDYEEDQDAGASPAVSPAASPQKSAKRKIMAPNVPSVPIDNVSFHCVEYVDRWKFVVKRRIAIERNLNEDFLKCQDIVNLIEEAGLIKTVSELGKCYDKLTREFLVNIPADCDDPL
ncbi:putative envelope-like protein, partial [Trifolium pratense]